MMATGRRPAEAGQSDGALVQAFAATAVALGALLNFDCVEKRCERRVAITAAMMSVSKKWYWRGCRIDGIHDEKDSFDVSALKLKA
jgi:hypothetical protein